MSNASSLETVFASIRTEYFPRWDQKYTWRVKSSASLHANGRCCPEQQLIVLRPDAEWHSAVMRKLLIHEICHAIASPTHGKPWQRRMKKAADRAKSRGDLELACLLREEVAGYQVSVFGTKEDIYTRVRMWKQWRPELTWPEILSVSAVDIGLSQREFLRTYPRAKTIFEKEEKELSECRAIREQALARRKKRRTKSKRV